MRRTQLYRWHKEHGKIVPFAGFEMPILYSSIKKEHMAVRTGVGIFDVSHMGRMLIEGNDALSFFNSLVPRNLENLQVGRGAYSFILNEHAGFRDDVVLFRLSDSRFMLVWNAGNLEKIPTWIYNLLAFSTQICGSLDVQLQNIASESAMFALQGPSAIQVIESLFDGEIPTRWGLSEGVCASEDVILGRTGYTGEDGFEISILNTSYENPEKAVAVWNAVLSDGDAVPCGLGARDTLRLESGFSLYGNDIHEEIDPISADLCFPPFVHLNKEAFFIGKEALQALSQKTPITKRVGFVATSKGKSPRAGMKILNTEGAEVGTVTSGSFSPLLNIGIGMGYVETSYADPGTLLSFNPRAKEKLQAPEKHGRLELEVRKFPLYNPDEYGHARK
ncbi:MAG: glycine cleavage system aminomethyltransferase GcvT [Candidatus Hodarchaeales archaeon]|jgi:aminomethyltransferase